MEKKAKKKVRSKPKGSSKASSKAKAIGKKSGSKTAVAIRANPKGAFQLALPGVISATSFDVPKTMDYPSWATTLFKVAQIRDAANWWLGDALNHGNGKLGESYAQAASETRLSEKTLQAVQYVASRVSPDIRVAGLTWSHHREVAKFTPEKQAEWLQRALESGWTVEELVDALKEAGERRGKSNTQVKVTNICAVCDQNEGQDHICQPCEALVLDARDHKLSKAQKSLLAFALEYITEPDGSDSKAQKAWDRQYAKLRKVANAVVESGTEEAQAA